MNDKSSNRKIAINTLFLYFRMMFTMLITLYTSRVVLQVLGVNDFGLYQVVGGIVGLLAFLNSALSASSSRFLTFELGTGNLRKLKNIFSTTLNIHIFLSVLVVILAETIGLWFVINQLTIPTNKINSILWVYHISIITSAITIIQVPFVASIISHERMKIYAYLGIIDVSLKLGAIYLLQYCDFSKLILYAALLCFVQLLMCSSYIIYCFLHFPETHYRFVIDKKSLNAILGFSGWSLFANLAIALNTQGTTILTNMFFGPAVVTARVISNQVSMAANQFVNNFRLAVNPQIVKKVAANDPLGSKKLLLDSTKYSFYLMLLLGLPIILLAEPLLELWLGVVPEYTVLFLQFVIIQSLFAVIDTSFYTALYAKGRLKENALISPLVGFLQFPVIYILFRMGYSPIVLSYTGVISYFLLGVIVKPILICKVAHYSVKEVFLVLFNCFKVTFFSLPFPMLLYFYYGTDTLLNQLFILFFSVFSVLFSVWFFGFNLELRTYLTILILQYIRKKSNNHNY